MITKHVVDLIFIKDQIYFEIDLIIHKHLLQNTSSKHTLIDEFGSDHNEMYTLLTYSSSNYD